MSDQHGATGAIRVTDEMVDRATTTYLENDDGPSASMREALNVALALVPPGADFRAGAEWAAKLVLSLAADRLGLPGRIACDAIHTALAALPEGGDGWRPIETVEDDNEIIVTDGMTTWADCLISAGDGTNTMVWDNCHPEDPQPTHWCRFPSPPSTQGSGT